MNDMLTKWWCLGWARLRALTLEARGALSRPQTEKGSVTIENVIWALAVIVIAAIVVAAITTYVTKHSNELAGS